MLENKEGGGQQQTKSEKTSRTADPRPFVRWFRGRWVERGHAFHYTYYPPSLLLLFHSPSNFHDGRASGSKTRPLPPATTRYPSPLVGFFFSNVVCFFLVLKSGFLLEWENRQKFIDGRNENCNSLHFERKKTIGKAARGQRAIRY